jgi:glycyl-tRNA synthetase alpha chain
MDQQLALPAYEQLLKCGHSFNLLDARGAISVTERASYIGRIRNLARAVARSYDNSRFQLAYPMWQLTEENADVLLKEFGDTYMATVARRAGGELA